MSEILGYGEDAFTFWALKKQLSKILEDLNDQTEPSDCLIFYRPGFGRSGVAEFGEFDAILASAQNIYLIESKWDNCSANKKDEIKLAEQQIRRHKIFSWYLGNWDSRNYSNNWGGFENDFQSNFAKEFQHRKIAPLKSCLAKNLEFVLNRLQEHCKKFPCEHREPKNVLLYFYDARKSKEISKVAAKDLDFEAVNINYSQYTSGNFVTLDC